MASRLDLQETWQSRIDRALEVRKEWQDQFKVKMARDFFEGQQNPGWPPNEWITINKIYSYIKSKMPDLYQVDPYFYVKVRRSFSPNAMDIALFEKRGEIRGAYLNYLKGELKLKPTARLAIQDAQFAYGVLKVHFSATSVDNPDAGNPILEGEIPLLGEDGEELLEPDTIPVNERYHWSRVHPDDFLWDADAGTLPDKWHWVAERFTMTKDQAKKDPDVSMAALKDAPTTTEKQKDKEDAKSQRGTTAAADRDHGKGEREIYVGWEIYDLEKKQWLKIIEGASRPVMAPQDVPTGTEHHPYSVLIFTPRDNSPYPIPPVSQGIDPQKEFNLSRSRILRHRKRFNRKYEVNENMLVDATEASKLESGDDGTHIMVKAIGAVSPIKDAPLDQQTYQEILLLNRDMVEVLGQADNSMTRSSVDSATEAALIDKRLEAREGDDLSLTIEWIADSAGKMDQLVQANITRDEAVKIAGPDGEHWEMVRVDDFQEIDGEFEYSVNVGSTLPRLPQVERSQFMAILQVFSQFPQIMTRPALMKQVLEMHRIDNDAILNELIDLGKQISSGAMTSPGASGSQPGLPTNNPITAMLGQAFGDQGGAANGGGGMET